MATIKAIEAHSVHQIQSGQVIVDLCSVVKELVENGLDAGANSIEVRFKNYGLDSIEVQDNGSGISSANYKSVALKHHTSKLSVYDDLSSLQTFGFRGEALSSLCALSEFYMITAQADEAPKGHRLDFGTSGELDSTSIVASQKGTTAVVESIFESLPVRRKELSKNIKREYAKVVGLLNAYACISTGVKFTVKNTPPSGKSMVVFDTKSNSSTKENIANIYGAKTLQALVALDLELEVKPSLSHITTEELHTTHIKVSGHISRPVWGEGRQSPDRQMFFVNGRPCGLPQVAKAMNEVYKSFNVSQSPFIFADFLMDTNAYDVNVSPDKRTILLHNAASLIDKLKETLNTLFDKQDQTVPQSQIQGSKLPAFKQLTIHRPEASKSSEGFDSDLDDPVKFNGSLAQKFRHGENDDDQISPNGMLQNHFRSFTSTREVSDTNKQESTVSTSHQGKQRQAERIAKAMKMREEVLADVGKEDDVREIGVVTDKADQGDEETDPAPDTSDIKVRDFNRRMIELQKVQEHGARFDSENSSIQENSLKRVPLGELNELDQPNIVQNAFDHTRPRRPQAQLATITIGDRVTTKIVGNGISAIKPARLGSQPSKIGDKTKIQSASTSRFSQSLRRFGAGGSSFEEDSFTALQHDTGKVVDVEDIIDSESSDDVVSVGEDDSIELSPRMIKVDQENSDSGYSDRDEEKAEEKTRVAELIRLAEEKAAKPTEESLKRANKAFKASQSKDSTVRLQSSLELTLEVLEIDATGLLYSMSQGEKEISTSESEVNKADASEEERLSLAVARRDFSHMEIIGQFNLGFILAVRKAKEAIEDASLQLATTSRDELFIIDQHASDEKYNFERLQATTIVSNQRLVRPIRLNLTAVEEEIVLSNLPALEKNGFIVEADTSGQSPVGQRCTLLTLPLSKEVTFDILDFEELIHLLAESPSLNEESQVPRPVKVRKMFAMRACRSSIMIGKTLTPKQMGDVLRHMGEIDKPWNCPHGRPTMRHLTSLDVLEMWKEGDGLVDGEMKHTIGGNTNRWKAFLEEERE